jgi:hypothetical protein
MAAGGLAGRGETGLGFRGFEGIGKGTIHGSFYNPSKYFGEHW